MVAAPKCARQHQERPRDALRNYGELQSTETDLKLPMQKPKWI